MNRCILKLVSFITALACVICTSSFVSYAEVDTTKISTTEKSEKQEKELANARKIIYGKSVQGRELEAYVISGSASSDDKCKIKVNGTLNVRSGPGLSYKTIAALKNGAAVKRVSVGVKKANGYVWDKIVMCNNKTGYAVTDYIKPVKSNGKTIFMTFALHGFEDAYYRDGQALTDEAMALIDYFDKHIKELKNNKLIIVPCANPDGVVAGKNNLRQGNNAFGRCTASHIDMNRDFGSFRAKESACLRDYIVKSKPNVYIDVHGWLNEVIGDCTLNEIIGKKLNIENRINHYPTQTGYAIDWVNKNLKIPSVLVEYSSAEEISTTNDIKMLKTIFNSELNSTQGSSSRLPEPVKWKNGSTVENVYYLNSLKQKSGTIKARGTAMCYGKIGKSYLITYAYGKKHKAGFVSYSGAVGKAPTSGITYKNGSTKETVYADTSCKVAIGSLGKNEKCKCLGIIDGMYLVVYNVNGTSQQKCGFVKYNGI